MRYVADSQDAIRNIETFVGCGYGMSYPAVISTSFDNGSITEPVTPTEAKLWCAIDGTSYDSIITLLITSARELIEGFVNLSIINRTVTAKVKGNADLPYAAADTKQVLQADITSITDTEGTAVTEDYKDLSADEYTVTYTVAIDALPSIFKTAILQQVAYMYENRGDETSGRNIRIDGISPIVKASLKAYRAV